jgi:hypothetical protein
VDGLNRWIMAASADLGLDPRPADARTILDLAREVAHNVDRPAAPVTAYLIGIAVGQGMPLTTAARQIRALTAAWPGRDED